MKVRFLTVPILMAAAVFAQNRGFGPRGTSGTSATPPTPAQLATREIQMVAAFLGLDATQTSALVANSTLAGELATEQSTLQSNSTALQQAYSTLGASIASSPSTPPAVESQIGTLLESNFQARVTAAGQIVTAVESLGLTSEQQQKLPNLVNRLVEGGLAGFGGPHR